MSDVYKKLLLVEDDILTATVQQRSLEKCNYNVVAVNSGEDAIDIVKQQNEIALVLMDIDLGTGIDGTEAAKQILEIKDIPVVFLSSHIEPEIVEKTERIISRIRAEELLNEQAFHFRSLLKNTDLGYFFIDKDGFIRDVNDGFINLYKYDDRDEIIGKYYSFIQNFNNSEGAEIFLKEIIADNNNYMSGEFQRICKDRSVGWHTFSARPVIDIPAEQDPRYHPRNQCIHHGFASVALIPIHENDNIIGLLQLNDYRKDHFSVEIIFILEEIADKIGSALMRIHIEERIQKLLNEKQLLLKDISHRHRNIMNTIMAFLSIHESNLKEASALEAGRNIKERINNMILLYDMLYNPENINGLPVSEYIFSLIDEIMSGFQSGASIIIRKEIDDIALDVRKKQIIGLIISELLTNIVKHAFNGRVNGLINVSLKKHQDSVILSMADNGIGLPEKISMENSSGLGIHLIKMFADQLGGRMMIDRFKGTKFVLEFEI